MSQLFKLSPSDLTFLWNECPRCFYLKIVRGFRRPAIPFPKIFSRIDLLMKDHYLNKSTKAIHADLPDGKVYTTGKWVESQIIHFDGHTAECYLKGIFDTVLKFDDGSYAVVDFKTTEINDEHIDFYARQLQAYAYALEHPAVNGLELKPISRLGLLCLEPRHMDQDEQGQLVYSGKTAWQEVPLDEAGFLGLLEEMVEILEKPEPPEAGEKCEFCKYREQARINKL
jgi:CRISPR/Cas system-associated exonuclease Cas4 (RecB family)